MAQQNINTGTLPNDKTGDSLRTAMIKVQNNFSELYTTAPISNSVNIGNTTSNVLANSTTVFIGNSGTYSIANSSSIITNIGYHSQVLNSGANNLVIGTTNATSILVYTNGITSANQRAIVAANGNVGIGNGAPNELLTVGGTLSANQIVVGNTTVNYTINSTFIAATANYALSANSANNTSFVGSVSAANVVSNSQLSANLSNYQTSAGLSANVATLTANNTSFVGSVSAANVVSNAQLSANLSNYQTTAGLTANVATLTANNTSFVGSVSAANVVSNAQLSANLSNYQTSSGLNANVAAYLPIYTGIINAASHTVGSSFIANSTGVFHTGASNAASHTVGSSFIANSVGITATGYANISGAVTASTLNDTKGDIRSVPINNQTSSYVLVANDAGKTISITTGGVTVPGSVFSNGDTIVVYNNSSANQTITEGSGVTMRLAATSNTGNRTIANYGLGTLICVSANVFILTGAGIS